LTTNHYLPKTKNVVPKDLEDDLNENISSDDFSNFLSTIIELSLHMELNDPPITLELKLDLQGEIT
jgi:hypothetical protein